MNSYISRLEQDSLAIFLFHGVVAEQHSEIRNYTRKHLPKDEFASLMASLRNLGTPISMDQVLDHLHNATPFPPNSFAITFDDGFENNHSVAAPVLADLDIPATFYVTTDFIDNKTMSWIDRIELAVEAAMPTTLKLPWRNEPSYLKDSSSAIKVLDDIRVNVKNDPTIAPHLLADDIFRQCEIEPVYASDHPLDQKMTWSQVAELHSHDLFTVGGHTHTHAVMSFCSPEELTQEIDTSLSLLENNAQVGPKHYSYPEGLAHCYSDIVIAELKKRGTEICPTAQDGLNSHDAHPFLLKRIMVD